MIIRHVIVLGALLGFAAPVVGQNGPPPQQAAEDLALAIEFQGLLEEYVTLRRRPRDAALISAWRDELAPQLDSLILRLEGLSERAGQPADVLLVQALCHAQRANLILDLRREKDRDYAQAVNLQKTDPSDKMAERVRALAAERSDLAERVASEYQTVESTLRESLAAADSLRGRREVNLILGVILAQSAIVQDRAIDSAEDAERAVTIDGAVLRELLDDAQELLLNYLEETDMSRGLEWVRGYFYLGVVQYRRSLKQRRQGEEYYTEVDRDRMKAFEAARLIFEKLSDPDEVLRILHPAADEDAQAASPAGIAYESSSFRVQSEYSYDAVAHFYAATANMYLGLIAAIDPQYDDQPPEPRLQAAEAYFEQAVTHDYHEPQPGEPPISLTLETVPESRKKVIDELEIAATQVVRRQPLHDLTISFGLSPIYDSNVTLLGRNTEAPIDKRRKRDFRVGTTFKLDYVADLDVLDPGNPDLQKWQVLLEGRVSPTWNARIHDFNEQFYGGTVNLRYELLGPEAVSGVDALYLHMRYSYDYVLLGNDGFLKMNGIRPSVQLVALDQVLDASLFLNYEDRNYLEVLRDERFDRDGNYVSYGLDTRINLGKWVNAKGLWGPEAAWGRWGPRRDDREFERPLEFNLGLEFTTVSTQGDEFDYEGAILTAGTTVPLPYGIDFTARALWEWQDYRRGSLIDRSRRAREDFIQEYGFRLERRFYLTPNYDANYEHINPLRLDRLVMTLFGDIRFTLDDSNVRDRLGQSIFEYNRVIYSAGIRFDLN